MVSYILCGCGLLSLVSFLFLRDKKSSLLAIALKTLTSLFFIATAIFAINLNSVSPVNLLSCLLVVFGLVFGLVGDIILDFKIYLKGNEELSPIFKKDKDIAMYTGMVSFGFGHVCYLSSILIRYPGEYLHLIYSVIIAAILMGGMIFACEKIMKMNYGKFRIISICYGALLMGFVLFSIRMIAKAPGLNSVFLLIGAIMFIVSDLILSVTYFSNEEDYKKEGFMNPESRFLIITNHATYYIAQFLIALSLLFI